MSSGKPSTPTVIGRFRVYEKTPGVNTEGMVDSNYFIRGYAIHGYAEVPTYAASHGCLRVPIPDAASIYAWVQRRHAGRRLQRGRRRQPRVEPTPAPSSTRPRGSLTHGRENPREIAEPEAVDEQRAAAASRRG